MDPSCGPPLPPPVPPIVFSRQFRPTPARANAIPAVPPSGSSNVRHASVPSLRFLQTFSRISPPPLPIPHSLLGHASPRRHPDVANDRTNAPAPPACPCNRIRSPNIPPPEYGLVGSTAITPTCCCFFR